MTLGRLFLAWLPVAVWFTCATAIARRLALAPEGDGGASPLGSLLRRTSGRSMAEALLLTLLASLWFDTLGTGAWWLPVALIGALVAIAPSSPRSRRTAALLFLIDVLRYVGAGALLVWRLG
ncbi:MAG TPA: hypothetical protein VFU75_00045 [Gemmatimonadales bacterium]|nr:hypothetical protein [Gemmatimonadales bacterium]